MKVLAIGNSFSQDATAHLHQTAAAQGVALDVLNLFIGGCPLERHWHNIEENAAEYAPTYNGVAYGSQLISIQDALDMGGWDVITLQQASHDSGWPDSYEPFLTLLVDYLRKQAPNARILLHETWAYDPDSAHPRFIRYNRSQQEMYDRLRSCYSAMAQKHGLELIPCGDVIQALRQHPVFDMQNGGRTLCRDGFHMSLGYGRYALACVWLRALCRTPVSQNPYVPFCPEPVEEPLLQIIRDTAEQMIP